jgi:hypothetical protein
MHLTVAIRAVRDASAALCEGLKSGGVNPGWREVIAAYGRAGFVRMSQARVAFQTKSGGKKSASVLQSLFEEDGVIRLC